MTTALILSGGGARAAYQVGVLKALSEITPHSHNPFPIVCGTSAGGINAMALTGQRGSFPSRVAALENIWRNLKAEEVYRTDVLHVLKNTMKLVLSLTFGGNHFSQPKALLDNSPIYELLERVVNFRDIDEAVAGGHLQAIAITAMSYGSGQSITFFQGDHDNWQRARRLGIRTGLTVSHLVASASIPTLFPAVKIGNQYFGDGAVRQLKPLSPALHLGASRLFVIGVSDNLRRTGFAETRYSPPTLAGMMGHMFNSAFIDSLESDLETLKAINRIARKLPPSELGDTRIIDYLCITPSVPINALAARYMDRLPRSVRFFLRTTGAKSDDSGASAASYLLFEPGFCGDLIDMGYEDCLRQRANVLQFFGENNGA
jgi:NTE family protein